MAYINISETQFAFTFFHKYLLLNKTDDLSFVFPSLRQEGDPNNEIAGADLVVNTNLFFQFKNVELLKTRNGSEILNGLITDIDPPYFRLWIKNNPPSKQFDLLVKAASKKGNIVRYVSPLFDYKSNKEDEDAFKVFFKASPIEAMNYVCTIDFKQFLKSPRLKISPDNSHKICYSRESVLSRKFCYVFLNLNFLK